MEMQRFILQNVVLKDNSGLKQTQINGAQFL